MMYFICFLLGISIFFNIVCGVVGFIVYRKFKKVNFFSGFKKEELVDVEAFKDFFEEKRNNQVFH